MQIQKRLYLAAACLLLVAATSYQPIIVRHDIPVEAYAADPAEYPDVFGLYKSIAGKPVCLASIIDSHWAITAAHCTRNSNFETQLASKGFPVTIGGKEVRIDRLETHPSWQGRAGFRVRDVALLHFDAPVNAIQPANLNTTEISVGEIVELIGWGATGNGTIGVDGHDGMFRRAENRIDSIEDRWIVWDFDSPLSTPEKSLPLEGISGPGDSGGPAYLMRGGQRVIVGISSMQLTRNMPEGTYGVTEYYTRVDTIMPWINQILTSDATAHP